MWWQRFNAVGEEGLVMIEYCNKKLDFSLLDCLAKLSLSCPLEADSCWGKGRMEGQR